jgi:GT2 family glycosyltransferase
MTHTGAVPPLPLQAHLIAPREIEAATVSVVVAVRNDLDGIRRVLASVNRLQASIRELIIVDDGSSTPLSAEMIAKSSVIPTQLIRTSGVGAGAARNVGVQAATGNWLWFVDSDCYLLPDALHNFQQASDGAIAYAGGVNAAGNSLLASYYDTHQILVPFGLANDGTVRHVVTANALVWREAFAIVGGFDACFYMSAGEDVDLGLRLGQIGRIKYVADAAVSHDYGGYFSPLRVRSSPNW